jgi:large subunit ribosomal protein L7/L12
MEQIETTNMKNIAEKLANLTILEVHELAKILKVEYGIEPSKAEVITQKVVKEEVIVEQTEFDVILKSFGANKLAVIRAIKELTGKSLMEAKTLVESTPIVMTEKISKEQAESLKSQLESVGAEAEIK